MFKLEPIEKSQLKSLFHISIVSLCYGQCSQQGTQSTPSASASAQAIEEANKDQLANGLEEEVGVQVKAPGHIVYELAEEQKKATAAWLALPQYIAMKLDEVDKHIKVAEKALEVAASLKANKEEEAFIYKKETSTAILSLYKEIITTASKTLSTELQPIRSRHTKAKKLFSEIREIFPADGLLRHKVEELTLPLGGGHPYGLSARFFLSNLLPSSASMPSPVIYTLEIITEKGKTIKVEPLSEGRVKGIQLHKGKVGCLILNNLSPTPLKATIYVSLPAALNVSAEVEKPPLLTKLTALNRALSLTYSLANLSDSIESLKEETSRYQTFLERIRKEMAEQAVNNKP